MSNVGVFGSAARGGLAESSDVASPVRMDEERGLLDLGGLPIDLAHLLGGEVDIVTGESFREHVRARVLADAKSL
jgi:predicted nucleotidyltransferase